MWARICPMESCRIRTGMKSKRKSTRPSIEAWTVGSANINTFNIRPTAAIHKVAGITLRHVPKHVCSRKNALYVFFLQCLDDLGRHSTFRLRTVILQNLESTRIKRRLLYGLQLRSRVYKSRIYMQWNLLREEPFLGPST